MPLKLGNNCSTILASSLSAGATTLTVAPAEGSKFPVLSAGDWHPLTLVKLVSGQPVVEIVKATARAGDVFTIVRAHEGTTAQAFSAGDRVELRATAGVFNEYVPQGGGASYPVLHADEFTADGATIGTLDVTGDAAVGGKLDVVGAVSAATVSTDIVRAKNFIDATVANAATTGAVTLDLATADVFSLSLTGATTLALSNAPTLANETFAIVVRINQGATAYALTWWDGITWLTPNGTAPAAPAASKTIEYVFTTMNGTNWLGRKGGAN